MAIIAMNAGTIFLDEVGDLPDSQGIIKQP
jgi:transcriptional regulator with PAS, ATPase and Fis domain